VIPHLPLKGFFFTEGARHERGFMNVQSKNRECNKGAVFKREHETGRIKPSSLMAHTDPSLGKDVEKSIMKGPGKTEAVTTKEEELFRESPFLLLMEEGGGVENKRGENITHKCQAKFFQEWTYIRGGVREPSQGNIKAKIRRRRIRAWKRIEMPTETWEVFVKGLSKRLLAMYGTGGDINQQVGGSKCVEEGQAEQESSHGVLKKRKESQQKEGRDSKRCRAPENCLRALKKKSRGETSGNLHSLGGISAKLDRRQGNRQTNSWQKLRISRAVRRAET